MLMPIFSGVSAAARRTNRPVAAVAATPFSSVLRRMVFPLSIPTRRAFAPRAEQSLHRFQVRNLRPLARRLAADRRSRQVRRAGLHDEIVRQRIPWRPSLARRRRFGCAVLDVFADQMTRDAELRVGFK